VINRCKETHETNQRFPITEIHRRPAEPQTFALTNSHDMLEKLRWEIDGLRVESGYPGWQEVAYRAFNCAVTAWSLVDWLWGDLDKSQQLRFECIRKFRSHCMTATRALEVCESLANSSKHRTRHSRLFNAHVTTTTMAKVDHFRMGDPVGNPLAQWQWKPMVMHTAPNTKPSRYSRKRTAIGAR
jgi:hypothetical protein